MFVSAVIATVYRQHLLLVFVSRDLFFWICQLGHAYPSEAPGQAGLTLFFFVFFFFFAEFRVVHAFILCLYRCNYDPDCPFTT